jgi:glycosyltransferase involved in cell wall biosynthesis
LLPTDAAATVLGNETAIAGRLRRLAYLQAGFAPAWRKEIQQQHAVLMHAHFALDAACALPLLTSLEIPLVVTLHGYDVTNSDAVFRQSRGGRLYLRRRPELFARVHTFICVSEFIRQKAIEAGFPRDRLWVHSIGIDLETFQPSQDSGTARQNGSPLVLFVGRLVEKKGCIHLLRAMRVVQERHPGTRLVIIGDGVLRPALERAAHELDLTQCSFLGIQPAHVIRKWLETARVFSVPSVVAANGDAEGLGMVFCEAQAMGVPVVTFASGGIPEAVEDGFSGLLVAEKDEAALAQGIATLLEDEALWHRMREHGMKRMAEKFDLRKQTDLLEAKYDEIITQPHAASGTSERNSVRDGTAAIR